MKDYEKVMRGNPTYLEFIGMRYIERVIYELLIISKSGGEFVRYEYIDAGSGNRSENKVKLVLKNDKRGRYLLLPTESKGERKIWNSNEVEAVDL